MDKKTIMVIYRLQNKINKKIYIGMTKHSLNHRIFGHLQANTYIGKALRKNGVQSFDISIIDTSEEYSDICNKEKYWICFYGSKFPNGYNFTDGGEGFTGTHSAETKIKISKTKTGYKFSEEAKKNMFGKTGPKSFCYGKPRSEETKRKIREKLLGKHLSDEHKQKLRKPHKPMSEETKQKMCGRKLTEETREKIRMAHIGMGPSEETKQKLRNWERTDEMKKKISDSQKLRYRNMRENNE